MNQETTPGYRTITYLLAVFACLVIIHFSDVVSSYYHKKNLRNMGLKSAPSLLQGKKPKTNKRIKVPPQEDSLFLNMKNDTTPVTTVIEKPVIDTSEDFFDQLIKEYKKEMLSSSKTRTDVVIRYYRKEKDHDGIYGLRKLGYYIHERPADNVFDQFASNAIYYGDSVKKRDIILIAHNLIQGGISIQNISLSKFHDTWKAHSIEIGTDTTAFDQPQITLAALRKKWGDM